MNFLMALAFTAISLSGLLIFRKVWIANPVFLFLIFNWIIGIGIIFLLDPGSMADIVHFTAIVISVIGFIAGGALALFGRRGGFRPLYKAFWARSLEYDPPAVVRMSVVLLIASVAISVLYYQAIGYNLAMLALRGADVDVTTMRLGAYAGEAYFAPGFVNQLKNTGLPVAMLAVFTYVRTARQRVVFAILMAPIAVYCLLGTGQRTFFVFFVLMGLIFISIIRRGRFGRANLIALGSIFFLVFTMQSVLLGRVQEFGVASGIGEVVHRIFSSNQLAAVVGFRYVHGEGIQYGRDWLQSVIGILPGHSGSDVSNRIFSIMYGGMRGTSPLSVWGSAYYNFGLTGALALGSFMGVIYGGIYRVFLSGRFTVFRIACYSAVLLYLSVWVAGSPIQLLNNGLATAALLLILRRVVLGTRRTAVGSTEAGRESRTRMSE